ncbi:hypothetical protein K435DRAFT_781510 [Dendrothele bispora CBS 962.96]|uniref:Uncharacterized protein n=1 Tax=Dendrothele bispora (strain CBS 962.96) TaxID=1314807 RepID=A0A4S8LKJ0_DENBC|nr:hypothetical protein K435DRAFT_781510 [Dendrothele bispora CBS 962.96]
MFYHDGLRTIAAETARHSSNFRATPTEPFFLCIPFHQLRIVTDFLTSGFFPSLLPNSPSPC